MQDLVFHCEEIYDPLLNNSITNEPLTILALKIKKDPIMVDFLHRELNYKR